MAYGDTSVPESNEEIGATDNILKFDPSDDSFAVAKGWKDGQTYKGVVVDVMQISPGECKLLAMPSGGTPEGAAPEEEGAGEPEPTEQPAPGGGMNPAVARMMAEEKA